MTLKYITTVDAKIDSANKISKLINSKLEDKERILFLTSGGSNIEVTYNIFEQIRNDDLSELAVSLVDERFVPLGSNNENWQQLLEKNVKFKNSDSYRIMQSGLDRHDTCKKYESWVKDKINNNYFVICLVGIGNDGHIAGIKPNSKAVSSTDLFCDYDGPDFERITATEKMLSLSDIIVVQASGTDKKKIISQTIHENIDINRQPSQMLKKFNNVTLYTDQEV